MAVIAPSSLVRHAEIPGTVSVVPFNNGHGIEILFDNGYGASVIDTGYGKDRGAYELAVIDDSGKIRTDTEITHDVLGWLTPSDVLETLRKIAALPVITD